MRVIIKPFGLALIVFAIVSLALLVYRNRNVPSVASTPVTSPTVPVSVPGDAIIEGGFENDYAPVIPETKVSKAHLSGFIAGNGVWFDNSSWSSLTAEYAPDDAIFHGGTRSQRVIIGANGSGHVQLSQIRQLSVNKDYEISAWVRASRRAKITLVLRVGEAAKLSTADMYADTTWRKISLRVFRKPTEDTSGLTWIMLYLRELDVTYWVDDAEIKPLSNTAASPPVATR